MVTGVVPCIFRHPSNLQLFSRNHNFVSLVYAHCPQQWLQCFQCGCLARGPQSANVQFWLRKHMVLPPDHLKSGRPLFQHAPLNHALNTARRLFRLPQSSMQRPASMPGVHLVGICTNIRVEAQPSPASPGRCRSVPQAARLVGRA